MSDQHRLTQYDDTTRPPVLHPDEEVYLSVPGNRRIMAGYRGPIPRRREYGFVQVTDSGQHTLTKLGAYALSDRLLRRIRTYGCKLVLKGENDTGRVYEFHVRQFDTSVPKRYNPDHDDDPQTYVKFGEARNVFEDHARSVIRDD